jgi:FAD-dependent urate hydroxylase
MARSLFVEDRARIRDLFDRYDTAELQGDEWSPWTGALESDNDAAA